jgi:hypothetical protein
MRKYKTQAQGEIHTLVMGLLSDEPADDGVVADTMEHAGGVALATEILLGITAAGNLIQQYLEQRERQMSEPANAKGRVRVMRVELARFESIAKNAEAFLALNQHPSYEDEQRNRLAVSAYGRRARELAQLESLLADPATYVPQSEAGHLRHLVLSAFAGGK